MAFGWHAIEIDGHDVAEIDAAYTQARNTDRPTMIVARTEKGHGVSLVANAEGWHGKALSEEQAVAAIAELGGERHLTITPPKPESFMPIELGAPRITEPPVYDGPIATRKAYGDALAWLAGHRPDVVALDGEVGNSTYSDDVLDVAPERFFEVYIAEQTMVGAQIGMQALGKVAFSATFGAFFTRATDFVRMGAIGRADLRLCGSHAGVSIGEDGPSQMALEDLATMRALNGSTVLYPADGNATVKLVTAMCDLPGISYIRTTREATPSIYGPQEGFPVGGSKTLASSPDDRVTLVGAGVTLHQCIAAAGSLCSRGDRGQGDRLLLRQADRRADVAAGPRGDRARRGGRGPSDRGRHRRRGVGGARRDRPALRTGHQGGGDARCRAPARRMSCEPGPGIDDGVDRRAGASRARLGPRLRRSASRRERR